MSDQIQPPITWWIGVLITGEEADDDVNIAQLDAHFLDNHLLSYDACIFIYYDT
jgi:hypothetical protein